MYHLFANNIQFFDAEMDFEKSSRAVRTLYFLKEENQWKPMHVVQLDGGLSDFDGISGAILNSDYDDAEMKKRADILIKSDGKVIGGGNQKQSDAFAEDEDEDGDEALDDESTLLVTSGSLNLQSSKIDEGYESTIHNKEEWDNWDKYIDIMVQTDHSKDEVGKELQTATADHGHNNRRWSEVDRQFFEKTCIPFYSEDFFHPDTFNLIK